MARLVLASRNRKKSAEIACLLAPHGIEVVSVSEYPDVPEIVEDGRTFAENAAKKAAETARIVGEWTLGEDSGLMVDALGGAPGIYSARYSGPGAASETQSTTDERNNAKLVAELAGIPEDRRGAAYVCNAAVADPEGRLRLQVEAICRGRIVDEPRGTHGFGYDPHFLIPEYHRTFGELGPVVKQKLSHRARALERLIPQLLAVFGSQAERD
jgi:XTP/dITP diphosphohydrolase